MPWECCDPELTLSNLVMETQLGYLPPDHLLQPLRSRLGYVPVFLAVGPDSVCGEFGEELGDLVDGEVGEAAEVVAKLLRCEPPEAECSGRNSYLSPPLFTL